MIKYFLCCLLIFSCTQVIGQSCTTLGQNPETAFPVCGTTTFNQVTVPICSNGNLPVPGCGSGYVAKNPFWYKFTCFQAGTLGFTITPQNIGDDYDWMLYDVTNRNVSDVFSNTNLIVTGSWSGSTGTTGTSNTGVNYIQCGSNPNDNTPRFANFPNLILGHEYLLMISHFDDTQSGYSLSFTGGSAIITDPKDPALAQAFAACDASTINVTINKDIKCSSLAANGSDFSLSIPGTTIISATSATCTASFNFNTLSITTSSPLPPGTYDLIVQNGSDGNTLLDNCNKPIPVGNRVSFTITPLAPTPFDSITPVRCEPQFVELVFKKKIRCSSIAADGSDFILSGPSAINIAGASGINCINGLASRIRVNFSSTIQKGGTYTLTLQQGSDGNTLLDECLQESLPASVNFLAYDTVNANFTFNINYSCAFNTVNYNHDGQGNANSWLWYFDPDSSRLQDPVKVYTNFDTAYTTLQVSNGVCADTTTRQIIFDNYLKAAFSVSPFVCPDSLAMFTNNSIGRIVNYNWQFGNGFSSSVRDPAPQSYPVQQRDYIAFPRLIIQNDYGCFDTVQQAIKIPFTCFIAVPSAFTPNGDGKNDFLYPLQAYLANGLDFRVFNRFGEMVFHGRSFYERWNGKYKGQPADAGTYVWLLNYKRSDTGIDVLQKGTTVLIR